VSYRLLYGTQAAKEIEKLSGHVLRRVLQKISMLSEHPRPHGCEKLAGQGGWRLRVGGYRILYEVDDAQRRVVIYRVQPRGGVYR